MYQWMDTEWHENSAENLFYEGIKKIVYWWNVIEKWCYWKYYIFIDINLLVALQIIID